MGKGSVHLYFTALMGTYQIPIQFAASQLLFFTRSYLVQLCCFRTQRQLRCWCIWSNTHLPAVRVSKLLVQ